MRMSPACGRGWLSSAVRAGSSATFIYTKAMTQASFANAAEFFNSLLGPRFEGRASEAATTIS